MPQFETVGIIAKQDDSCRIAETLARLVVHLRARRRAVLLDAESVRKLKMPAAEAMPIEALGQRCALVIVVGGDGTLLHAARTLAHHGVPLLGINLGRIGFLVDILPEQLEPALDQILAGEFVADHRSMLQAQVIADAWPNHLFCALNDVVMHKWNTARMIEFGVSIDGKLINTQRSDGLIVSTPTGSTAYALSGGGPLLDPGLDVMLLVPICPHDLSNRPLVTPGASTIEVAVCEPQDGQVQLTCDGQVNLSLPGRARIQITRHPNSACLLHPPDHSHYGVLRAKLRWGGNSDTAASSC